MFCEVMLWARVLALRVHTLTTCCLQYTMGVLAASPQLFPMLALPSATDILLWLVSFNFAFYGMFHVKVKMGLTFPFLPLSNAKEISVLYCIANQTR